MDEMHQPEGRSDPALDAVVQLSFGVQALLGAVAARHELSLTQLRLLAILRDREPSMLDLARYLNLEKSSATGLVDRAQKRGLVERAGASHDGRAVHVRLTSDGRRLVGQLSEDSEATLSALLADLSPTERARLGTLAERLNRRYAAIRGIAPGLLAGRRG